MTAGLLIDNQNDVKLEMWDFMEHFMFFWGGEHGDFHLLPGILTVMTRLLSVTVCDEVTRNPTVKHKIHIFISYRLQKLE